MCGPSNFFFPLLGLCPSSSRVLALGEILFTLLSPVASRSILVWGGHSISVRSLRDLNDLDVGEATVTNQCP